MDGAVKKLLADKVISHTKVVPTLNIDCTYDEVMDEDDMMDDEQTGLLEEEDEPPPEQDIKAVWTRVKDWIEAQQWPFSVNDRALIVRVYRWIMLFVLIGFGFLCVYIYLDETTVNKNFMFDEDILELEVSACRIWLKQGTDTGVTAHVSSQTQASYFNQTQPDETYFETTETTLKMINPNGDVDACDIHLESSAFPDLTIICTEWSCPIIQLENDELLTFTSLTISHDDEADGNVYLHNIEARDLFVNITGTVMIEQLSSTSGGTVISQDGDVWIQSMQEIESTWKTYVSSAYQFVGPNAYHASDPVCEALNITLSNNTFEVNNCEGNSVVCITAGCAGEYSLDLTATDGGVYVQLLESAGTLYADQFSVSYLDDDTLISHAVDLLSKIEILKTRDELTGEVVKDQFFTLTMAGVNYDIGQWLFTTKEAYTQLKPWWIQMISFGLLLPEPKHTDLRLVPWPIIQSEPFDTDDMTVMGPIWNIIFGEFGSDPDQFLLWMDESDDSDNWYKISQTEIDEYERELQEITDNTSLLAALWMSFALGLVGAVAGAIVAWWALGKYSRMFWENLDHKKRYKRIQLSVGNRGERYDQTFRDSIGEKDMDNKPIPGEGNFPPPFAVADILVSTYQKHNQGSLEEFLKVVVKEETEEQISVPFYRVRDIKERYESFCFANDYHEEVIRNKKEMFLKYGFELRTMSDSTTEAFKHIRRKTEQEIRDEPEVRQIPGEDSLSFFVRAKFTKTAFDHDIVFLNTFMEEYDLFCKRSKKLLKIVPCTKRAMVTLGFDFERLTVNIVRSTDGSKKLDMAIADELIYKPNLEPMPTMWYFYDIMAILVHLTWIGVLLFPIVASLVFQQHMHASMSTQPQDRFLTFQDVRYRPWRILDKQEHFEIWTIVMIAINVVILILSLIELLCYYTTRDIPFQLDKIITQTNMCHTITQNIFYVLIYFVAALCSGYVIIGLCWCILGAVLNPEIFLPYAAAAATFISFILLKIKNAVNNWESILREITEIMTARMNFMLHEMLDRVIGKIKFDGAKEMIGEAGSMGAALASGRYMYALQKTPLGDVMDGLGLDPEMIIAIANGDPAAIGLIAEKFGIDKVIVEALSAAVTQDLDALAECIPKLSAIPGIDIDPEVAKTFVMLAWNPSEVNIRTSVKTAVIQFTRIMNNKLSLGLEIENLDAPRAQPGRSSHRMQSLLGSSDTSSIVANQQAAAAEPPALVNRNSVGGMAQQAATGAAQQLNINPRVIDALVSMASGDISYLRDILFEFENGGYIPKHTCKIFDFLKCLNSFDHEFVQNLLDLLHAFCSQLEKPFTTGLGCLVSDKFHGYVQRTKVRKGNYKAKWPEIDELLNMLGIQDEAIIVKVIMCLTRNSRQTLQRFIPGLVRYLNRRLSWNLNPNHVKSIFTMVNGVKLNITKLTSRWDVDASAIHFFPSMMLCPFEKQNILQHMGQNFHQSKLSNSVAKHLDHVRSMTPSHPIFEEDPLLDFPLGDGIGPPINSSEYKKTEEDEEEEKQNVKPPSRELSMIQEQEESSLISPQNATALISPLNATAPTRDIGDAMKVLDLDMIAPERRISKGFTFDLGTARQMAKVEESPSVKILKHSIRPTSRSMSWLAKRFKLQETIVMGIFITIRRAYREHNQYVEPLIKDVLRRIGVDSMHLKVYMDIFKLIVSVDEKTIRKAHGDLNLKFVELALISSHVMHPKDLPAEYLTRQFGFDENDKLIRMRLKLNWDKNPLQCDNWCKALSIEVGKRVRDDPTLNQVDYSADKLQLLMARSLLMMSVRAPALLIKKLLQINCQADDVQINDFKTLISAHYIKKMELDSNTRETVIKDLSRLFELPQESLRHFIGVSLAFTSDQRGEAMKNLLDSFKADNLYKEKVLRVVWDAKHQLDTAKQNVENFAALGDLLGLPPKFIESLSPGIINVMSQNRTIMKKFIAKFAEEFGVKTKKLQESISAFVMNESSGVEQIGQVFGLKEKVLTRAVKLFGVQHPEESIEEISSFLNTNNKRVKNVAKAFSGLIAGFTGQISRERDEVNKTETAKFYAPRMLETQLNISKYIFMGVMSSIQRDEPKVKMSILKLCQRSYGKFDMDDALCRGFLSISTGGIEGIEDICQIINYSADYAEVLVMLANQNETKHSTILQNQIFKSLCIKLGLKAPAMAAMLALTQQDIDNNDEICEDLGSDKQFPPHFIKALMAVYKFSTINGDQHENYDPKYKKQMMLENIKPLANLVDIKDSVVASFIVGLAQGNAGVIEDIFQRFGWNGTERSTYGAFCCLFHPFPFNDDDADVGLFDWIADKELGQVCSVIGTLLKLDAEGIEKIVMCAREDPSTLQWLIYYLDLPGLTDAKNFVKIATNDGELVSEDDDMQEDELDEDIDWKLINDEAYVQNDALQDIAGQQDAASSKSSVSEAGRAEMDNIIAGDNNKEELKLTFDFKFANLINVLNAEFKSGLKKFSTENVKLLMYLAAGKFGKFENLQLLLSKIYNDKPPVDFIVIQELLSITSGKYENVRKMIKEELPKYEHLEIASKSVFKRLELKPKQLEFLMKLASRDESWLDIEYEKGQKISQKIMPDAKLAKAVFGLCSLEPMAVARWVPKLSKYLEIDVDMAQILVLLSNQALNRAVLGIAPLAERLEMETNITNSFCCMAYSDLQLRMDAIKVLCDRLELKNVEQVNAILTIIAGDFYVGWDLLTKLVYFPVKDAEVNLEGEVLMDPTKRLEYESKTEIFQYFLQILARRWDVQQVALLGTSSTIGGSNINLSPKMSDRNQTLKNVNSPLAQQKSISFKAMVNSTNITKKNDALKERSMVFGQEQVNARQRIADALGFSKPELVDFIIGISQNTQSIVQPTLRKVLELDRNHVKLVEELLHLYNANDSEIPDATDYIEDYIKENTWNEDNLIPHGLLQAIYGSVREFNEVMVKGIARGLESSCNQWGSSLPKEMQHAVPLIMVYAGQPQSCYNYLTVDEMRDASSIVVNKLLGIQPSQEHIEIFQALISSDVKTFVDRLYALISTAHPHGFELIKEILNLVEPGVRMDSLTHITQIIMEKYGLPQEFTDAMILVLSDSHEDQKEGEQTGMDEKLYQLISFFVKKLAGELRINSTLANQLFQEIEGEPAIMKILDACFLAFKDPQANTKQVLNILPTVARALLGDTIPEKAIKLISGIIKLFKAEDDENNKLDAIIDLASSFDIDTHLVKGFLALAKGDWRAMKEMIARICEFDEQMIDNIVNMILHLRKAKAADNIQEKTEETTDKYEQLKQRIPDGTDVEAVFEMLDTSGDGTLYFTEFQEAFKIYNLPMSEERQLEIFTRFDTEGEDGQLSLQNFVQCMAYIRKEVSRQAMDSLGFSVGANIGKILIAIAILLMLFVFIFLGISGFTTNSTLGSVVNSLMPVSAGSLLGKAGGTNVTEVIKKIKDSVEQRLSVLTMNDV